MPRMTDTEKRHEVFLRCLTAAFSIIISGLAGVGLAELLLRLLRFE